MKTYTLMEMVGQLVRLHNDAYEQGEEGRLQIHMRGILQYDSDYNNFTVNAGDHPSGHGLSTVTFTKSMVTDLDKNPSGIFQIVLR